MTEINHQQTETGTETKPAIVMGLGGGGGRIVTELGNCKTTEKFRAVAADTDQADLAEVETKGITPLRLGREWECEDGCGGDPELAEKIAVGSEDALLETVDGARLLIVVAGLGAGTGTGACQILARLARDQAIPTLFILTLPFSFEGNWPRQQAETALAAVRDITDAVIVIHNDLLFTAVAPDIPAREAFRQIDQMLAKAVAGLVGIAWADWLLKTDFAAIRNLLQKKPDRCNLGFGRGSGAQRWRDAIEEFVKCPLLGGPEHLRQFNTGIITVGSDSEISVAELRECMTAAQQHFPDNTRLLIGAYSSPLHEDEVQITGLCCLFNEEKQSESYAPRTEKDDAADELRETADNRSQKRVKQKKRPPDNQQPQVQEELPFQEEVLGIFSGTSPTIYQGENLDAPTFQRRGLQIDLGKQIQ